MARSFLTPVAMNLNQITGLVIEILATDPSGGALVSGRLWYNSTTNQVKYYNGSSVQTVGTSSATGTVTSVSVVSANGFAGTVATSTSTPAITLTTSITGLLKGNGTAISAATAGTDYLVPTGNGSSLTGITNSQVSGSAPTASPTFTGTVTVPTTVNPTDAAQKQYVDSVAQGLDSKPSVVVVSTVNQASISGLLTIDGVTLTTGQRVLLSGQTTTTQNGLWVAASGAWTRPTDFASASVQSGTYVFVEGGTANANSGWIMVGTSAVTVDTSTQAWTQFTGAGEVLAGTGLSKSANTISLTTPVAAANGGAGAVSGIMKANGSGTVSAAAAGTDYAAATSGSSVLKGNGSGGFASAKYTTSIGDGSTLSYTVTHSLGTRDVIVQIYDATTYVQYECDVTRTSTSVVTLAFAVAPTTNQINVVVIG